MRVHLGSGKQPLEGYVNVDCCDLPGVEVVSDAGDFMSSLADGTVIEVLSLHMIEHLEPVQWFVLLRETARALAPGGILVLECPDLGRVCECFVANTGNMRWSWWHQCLYGDANNGGSHKQGFTIQRLREELEAAGLRVTRAVPWGDNNPEGGCVTKYNLRVEAVKP